MHYRDSEAGGQTIDWNVVWDNQAGPFAYGFDSETSAPAQFYMEVRVHIKSKPKYSGAEKQQIIHCCLLVLCRSVCS